MIYLPIAFLATQPLTVYASSAVNAPIPVYEADKQAASHALVSWREDNTTGRLLSPRFLVVLALSKVADVMAWAMALN